MLRKRPTRGYNETNDEEEDGGRKYNVREKIKSQRFKEDDEYLQELSGDQVTLKLVQKHGFSRPLLVKEPDGLNLRVPPKSFLVRDVRDCVGLDRIIDVMDVRTQKNIEMTMKDWCKYYESKRRDKLLNVISLEFSHTELDDMVEAPSIVRLLDWVDQVWPKFLKESQTESTNKIDRMKYPKVQKYCLMSVKGSYTDFHIDFGGTSVWYHILRGKKIFWMVPPTELNLTTFEEWTLSGAQQEVFFGDLVEQCFKVELTAGNTFFIPSGWIHAVYTLEDSLVFGGNFLHSFGIENQLRVSKVEDATKVPVKFRYPFYTEIQWYAVQHYVRCLTGKDHLHPVNKSANSTPEKPKPQPSKSSSRQKDDDEDEETDTGSEIEESDMNKTKRRSIVKKKSITGKRAQAKRGRPPKKTNDTSSDDKTETDSETEIDTEIDSDLEDKNKIKPSATCRMTKNSLLRMQYEVDEPNEAPSGTIDKTSPRKHSKSPKIENMISVSNCEITEKTSLDLDSFIYTQDQTRLNGWSSSSGQPGNQISWSNPGQETKEPSQIHITKYELNGLKLLVKHLSKLSGAKKNLPTLIRNSRLLLDDCKKMTAKHENDDPELAVTGIPITTDLLKPKKSDINELIEQFFKPSESNASDGSQPHLNMQNSKLDSATLTNQQRNKFINSNIIDLFDDKKIPGACNDNSSQRKESKISLSPNRKSTGTSSAKLSSPVPLATSTTSSTTNFPVSCSATNRPKSPPTRPLSNNQYTSKFKKESSLVLPGSFADLIAATSTEKKVFDVSPSEVTSALFGSKDGDRSPIKQSGSISPQKIIQKPNPFDILEPMSMVKSSSCTSEPTHKEPQPPKANSPEPPKMSPPKRFINPAFKPQNKEKLIFASAPYVSPVSVSSQSRPNGHYPWQGPAVHSQLRQHDSVKSSHLTSSHHSGEQQQSTVNQDQGKKQRLHHDFIDNDRHSRIECQSISNSSSNAAGESDVPMNPKLSEQQTSMVDNSVDLSKSLNDSERSLKIDTSREDSFRVSAPASRLAGETNPAVHSNIQAQQKHQNQSTNAVASNIRPEDEPKVKKQTKPRGPPKKSKEARQVIIESPPRPVITTAPRFLITHGTPMPIVAGPSNAPMFAPVNLSNPNAVSNPPEKQKTKKAKKQKRAEKEPAIVSAQKSDGTIPTTMQPLICGLVAPTMSNQVSSSVTTKPTQQYLISRPLLFNTLPPLSASQLQQMQRAPIPMMSTAMSSPLGIAATQPGARIVWATQQRLTTAVTPANGLPKANPTGSSVKISGKSNDPPSKAQSNSRLPTNQINNRQSENSALLSLATTALSTAPMATTPAMGYLSSVRPQAGQAIMVSSATGQPALLTSQPFFSPFIPRLPMAGHYPAMGINPAMPNPMVAARPIVPMPGPRPAGQLLFARLPNQQQPRYLITQPYVPPNSQATTTSANQTLTFASFRPPCPQGDTSKQGLKTKKVKTR